MIEADYTVEFKSVAEAFKFEALADFIANYVVSMAKIYVPVRTGRLKASIHVDHGRSVTTPSEIIRVVVASTPYAATVEFGRTSRAPFPGRFYMKSAVEATTQFIRQYVSETPSIPGLISSGGE